MRISDWSSDVCSSDLRWPELAALEPTIARQVEIEGRYQGYLARQEADVRAFRKGAALMLPSSLDHGQVGGLSAEVQQLLSAARPASLGAASRIPGITPEAILALLRHVKKRGPGAGAQRGSAAQKK